MARAVQHRRERCGDQPEVWYDTSLHDWVVRLPCDGNGEGAVVPLELRCFDVPLPRVLRTAAAFVYAADVLIDHGVHED